MSFFRLAIVFLFCFSLKAQNKKSPEILITFNGGQGLHYLVNFDDVNSNLQSVGYPSINKPLSKQVGGIGLWINRFYIQGGDNTFSVRNLSSADYTTKLNGTSFEVLFGYNILRSGKLRLFPYVGFGGQNSTIYIDPKEPPAFAGVLSNPSTSASTKITISDISSGIIGVGFDWKLMSMLNNLIDLNATFRGAYQYCSRGDWRVNEQLTTPPNSNFSGVNFTLGLQLGLRPRFKSE